MSDRVSRSEATERWYEFEQVETFARPYYVKARSLKEARIKRHTEGTPDYPPSHPDLEIRGRGRIADQELAQAMAEERGDV